MPWCSAVFSSAGPSRRFVFWGRSRPVNAPFVASLPSVNCGLDYLPAPYSKLLYLGDVPVESTVYGAVLLHRLLAAYPPADLVVLEANAWKSRLDRRLTAIRYETFPMGNSRLLNSRLRALYGSWLLLRMRSKWKCVDSLLQPFSPQAVVTVTNGYSWLAAAEYALLKKLPLHLILHDDWPGRDLVISPLRGRAQRLLAHYYRAAASRLCISPAMAQVYRNEFSAPATVLYPCSANVAEAYREPPEAILRELTHPIIAFGGTVSGAGQAQALRVVAEALVSCGGRLLLYGPMTRERSRALGLDLPNIELQGMLSSAAMMRSFRERADVLLLPQSFLERDRRQSVMSFPSKIADYTAVGLPLLIVAPQFSSLVQWCSHIYGLAEIVTEQQPGAVQSAIQKLMSSPHDRQRLAVRALEVHRNYFSHATVWAQFSDALRQATVPR
jgi:glycosyltransferase involved in cell wall biosynthesis